jgi:transcriptional regulator NrdR family protein
MIKVLKRNGQLVEFNKEKIINAINKAFLEVDG